MTSDPTSTARLAASAGGASRPQKRTVYLVWWKIKGETWDEMDSPCTYLQMRDNPPPSHPERLGSAQIGLKVIAMKKVTIMEGEFS